MAIVILLWLCKKLMLWEIKLLNKMFSCTLCNVPAVVKHWCTVLAWVSDRVLEVQKQCELRTSTTAKVCCPKSTTCSTDHFHGQMITSSPCSLILFFSSASILSSLSCLFLSGSAASRWSSFAANTDSPYTKRKGMKVLKTTP